VGCAIAASPISATCKTPIDCEALAESVTLEAADEPIASVCAAAPEITPLEEAIADCATPTD
jgi:hypothetical protein